MRRQKANTNSSSGSERSVRRISYLRATANDMSLQESAKKEEQVEETKDEKTNLSDELQMLSQFFKRYVTGQIRLCGKHRLKFDYDLVN